MIGTVLYTHPTEEDPGAWRRDKLTSAWTQYQTVFVQRSIILPFKHIIHRYFLVIDYDKPETFQDVCVKVNHPTALLKPTTIDVPDGETLLMQEQFVTHL